MGTYAPFASNQCFECKEGYDCSAAVGFTLAYYRTLNLCQACYYCAGKTKIPCPAGYFCPAASRRIQACPVGTYSTATGLKASGDCTPTPAGYYNDKSGSTAYSNLLCALGFSCPLGSYNQFAYRCPRGTYQNQTGAATCTQCPAGYYCNETAINPIECP